MILSFLSGLYHSVFFEFIRPVMKFDKGMLILSIDVDVGSKELGVINQGKNDVNVSSRLSEYKVGEIEEIGLPQVIKLFDNYDKPATFAVRGQLTELPDSVLTRLLKSKVHHDVGAHGYYHTQFKNLSHDEAEAEIKMISNGMQRFGLTPKSFIFPRNSVAHLDLLEKFGYECYREYSNFRQDSMRINKVGNLWNLHPSLAIDRYTRPLFLKRLLNIAIDRRLPLHLWFHTRDFTERPISNEINKNLEKVFVPFFEYVNKKESDGVLTTETMISAARIARALYSLESS